MSTSLRDKHRKLTRDLIIDALAEVIAEDGVRKFSLEEVAARAGVSLRTLYRYYSNREELLQGLVDKLDEALGTEDNMPPPTLQECLDCIPVRAAEFSKHEKLSRAAVAIHASTNVAAELPEGADLINDLARARVRRTNFVRDLLAQEFPDMPSTMVAQLTAVTRLMVGITGWAQMSAFDLDNEDGGIAVQWAALTLVRRFRELDRAGVRSLAEDL